MVDYFLLSVKRIVCNVKVLPGVSLDSDRIMIVVKIMIKNFRKQLVNKWKIIKTKSLKVQNIRAKNKH